MNNISFVTKSRTCNYLVFVRGCLFEVKNVFLIGKCVVKK